MAKRMGSKVLAVSQPKNDNCGPGSQAKTYTRAGYPESEESCVPNRVDQKPALTRTHQGLYN